MKTLTFNTAWQRSSGWARGLAWVSLAAGVWALSAGAAQARGGNDVVWSVGVHQPGVSVGVSNAPPVVVHQRPRVVVVERPVIYERPVVYQRPVVVQQRRVVVQPLVVHDNWGYRRFDERRGHQQRKWHKRHEREDRYERNDRYDRHSNRWNDR